MSSIPPIGTVLAGKYRVESVLGAGGMGVVLAAMHAHLQERVAIKLLNPEALSRPGAVDRFVREARVAMRLRGEHVVRILDVGMLPTGAPFIVMEYLHGRDLSAVLREGGAIERVRAVDYLLQVCEAIAEAHAHGVVHRDLKPANLFLTKRLDGSDCIKVLDFGVSKIAAEPADVLGTTAPYSVREGAPGEGARAGGDGGGEARGDHALPRARRVTAVHGPRAAPVGAGRGRAGRHLGARDHSLRSSSAGPPFDADTLDELTAAVIGREAPELAGVPAPLAAVVARALAKSPGDRYPDVQAFAQAVAPFGSEGAAAVVDRIGRVVHALDAGRKGPGSSPPPVSADSGPGRAGDVRTPFEAGSTLATRETSRTRRRLLWMGAAAVGLAGVVGLAGLGRVIRRPPPLPEGGPRSAAPTAMPFHPTHLRRLTFGEGCEEFPSFAPDGKEDRLRRRHGQGLGDLRDELPRWRAARAHERAAGHRPRRLARRIPDRLHAARRLLRLDHAARGRRGRAAIARTWTLAPRVVA